MKVFTKNDAFSLLSPIPYVVVTSLDKNNKPNALGVAWVTRTSWEPFLVLISIGHSRYSYEGIKFHKEFVINYPSKHQKELALIAGTRSGKDIDKIKLGNIELINSILVKVPTINNVSLAFECKVVSEYVTGDHTVFVGEVVKITGNPENNATLLFCTNDYQIIAIDSSGIIQN